MSRRMDREGVMRSHTQYVQNMRAWADPRCKEDERGWVQPYTVWQGWEEYNRAAYALWRILLQAQRPHAAPGNIFTPDGRVNRTELHRSMDASLLESDLRTFRFCLARSSRCDRPAIPRTSHG